MKLMESFGGGCVPPAWYALYSWIALIKAAASFGYGSKKEGYRNLDCALTYYRKWSSCKDGEAVEVGNPVAFGGVKLLKGEDSLILPDETKEPVEDDFRGMDAGTLYHAMTASYGWEWFNSVRAEERFKEYIASAKKLMEAE